MKIEKCLLLDPLEDKDSIALLQRVAISNKELLHHSAMERLLIPRLAIRISNLEALYDVVSKIPETNMPENHKQDLGRVKDWVLLAIRKLSPGGAR